MGEGVQENSDDIFHGNSKIMIKQEFALLECFSCEAKNRYRISIPNGESEGPDVFLYINEDSGCLERICCSVNRSLTLNVHEGSTRMGKFCNPCRSLSTSRVVAAAG